MFTIEQIKLAHSKVRSGADFPLYIKELKQLGVVTYETFVTDGRTNYFGAHDHKTSSPPKYSELLIASTCNSSQFMADLKTHQQGKTDYPTFCNDCARSGIEKWVVNIPKMTFTYSDMIGNEILVERISE